MSLFLSDNFAILRQKERARMALEDYDINSDLEAGHEEGEGEEEYDD